MLQANHPYRALPETIYSLSAKLGSGARRRDAAAAVRALRQEVDRGAADLLSRNELAGLIEETASCRDEIRRKFRPLEGNINWISGGIGSIGVITTLVSLRYGSILLWFAMLFLAMSRLAYVNAKRWLDVADELDGLVGDMRDIAQKLRPGATTPDELRRRLRALPGQLERTTDPTAPLPDVNAHALIGPRPQRMLSTTTIAGRSPGSQSLRAKLRRRRRR